MIAKSNSLDLMACLAWESQRGVGWTFDGESSANVTNGNKKIESS